MDDRTAQGLLAEIQGICLLAGREIRERGPSQVEFKPDGSPVTAADLAAHDLIAEALSRLEPRFPVLSEEGELECPEFRQGLPDYYWLVDPLDGTRDFLKGYDSYTVNIALVRDGRPILGSVYAPATGELYFARQDAGAWKQDPGLEARPIAATGTEHPPVAVVSRSHLGRRTREFLERHGIERVIATGSSIKICLVAEGRADLYPRLGPTSLWDTAAGAILAREAGCRVVDLEGRELKYDCRQGLLHQGFLVYAPRTFTPRGLGNPNDEGER